MHEIDSTAGDEFGSHGFDDPLEMLLGRGGPKQEIVDRRLSHSILGVDLQMQDILVARQELRLIFGVERAKKTTGARLSDLGHAD